MLARKIIKCLEELAPPYLALKEDPTGLQVGTLKKEVTNILVSLDVNKNVLQEAVDKGANLIITHHPLIFDPLKRVEPDSPLGSLIYKAIKEDITIYSLHTNLDVAEEGVNRRLAELLSLKNESVLKPTYTQNLYKIAVFVPRGYEEQVREAMAEAGAGCIGDYSHCTFTLEGTGTFKPLEGSNPFIGEKGKVEEVAEVRLETVMTEEDRSKVIDNIVKAHPYEEVPYDLYLLSNKGKVFGLGRLGVLPEERSLSKVVEDIKKALKIDKIKITGSTTQKIKKVALCGGSGGRLIEKAASEGAHLYLTSDIKYHEALKALDLNIIVADAGHDATERIIVPYLADYLNKELSKDSSFMNSVIVSEVNTSPWEIW